jgi:hypothetical protein
MSDPPKAPVIHSSSPQSAVADVPYSIGTGPTWNSSRVAAQPVKPEEQQALAASVTTPSPSDEEAAVSADIDAILKRLDNGIPRLNQRLDDLQKRLRRPLAV